MARRAPVADWETLEPDTCGSRLLVTEYRTRSFHFLETPASVAALYSVAKVGGEPVIPVRS